MCNLAPHTSPSTSCPRRTSDRRASQSQHFVRPPFEGEGRQARRLDRQLLSSPTPTSLRVTRDASASAAAARRSRLPTGPGSLRQGNLTL
eukprot:524034-Prorocentrum_minimum.AAC.3